MIVHIQCNKEVSIKDVSEGYAYQCPNCDEDLYKFETKEKV